MQIGMGGASKNKTRMYDLMEASCICFWGIW